MSVSVTRVRTLAVGLHAKVTLERQRDGQSYVVKRGPKERIRREVWRPFDPTCK